MKNARVAEYFSKVKVEEYRSFIKRTPYEDTEFEIYLKKGDFSKEQINQIGEELQKVIDDRLESKDFLEKLGEAGSYRITISIIIQKPYPDWAKDKIIVESILDRRAFIWIRERSVGANDPIWRKI
jgi:hypothetical protein